MFGCQHKNTRERGAVVAEWLSSWLAEQEDRGSIPGLATWIFRDWLSPASKSRYGWKNAKSTLILKTTNQPTRGNELKLKKRRSKLNIRKYVYTNRITDIWNSLPNVVVRSKNVKNFEIALDRHWSDEDVKFDFKSDISLYTGSHVKSRYTVDDEIEADTVAEMPASTEDPKVS